jgi:hypothetical protein
MPQAPGVEIMDPNYENMPLIAAAYVIGVFSGVAADRTDAWRRRRNESWLCETEALRTAERLLDGEHVLTSQVFHMQRVAELLGHGAAHAKRIDAIGKELRGAPGSWSHRAAQSQQSNQRAVTAGRPERKQQGANHEPGNDRGESRTSESAVS